jgi:hypothetical protein
MSVYGDVTCILTSPSFRLHVSSQKQVSGFRLRLMLAGRGVGTKICRANLICGRICPINFSKEKILRAIIVHNYIGKKVYETENNAFGK